MVGNFICHIFNLRPSEVKNVLSFAILAFLWASASFSGMILSDGFFIEKLGAHYLPHYYLLSALTMFFCALFMLYVIQRFHVKNIFIFMLFLGSFFYTVGAIYTHQKSDLPLLIYFVFKLFSTLFTAFCMTCFWTFVDGYYHMQDAKRLYCLFNSTIYFGDAMGSLYITELLEKIPLSKILMIITLLLLAALSFILKIEKHTQPICAKTKATEKISVQKFPVFWNILKKSPFTLSLIGLTFFTYLISVVAEYSYMNTFRAIFENQPKHTLTIFLAKLSFWVSFSNMLFGLLFYSRLVKRAGVNNLAPITGLLFLLYFFQQNSQNSLIWAAMGFAIVEGVVYAIDDNNFNLLINAIPTKIKYAVRAILESFIEYVGLASGALFLLYFPTEISHYWSLALTICLLAFVFFLRSSYPQAILHNLKDGSLNIHQENNTLKKLSTQKKTGFVNTLLQELKQKKLPQQFVMECIFKLDTPSFSPQLWDHLQKEEHQLQKLFYHIHQHKHKNIPHLNEGLCKWKKKQKAKSKTHANQCLDQDIGKKVQLLETSSCIEKKFQIIEFLENSLSEKNHDLGEHLLHLLSKTFHLPLRKKILTLLEKTQGKNLASFLLKTPLCLTSKEKQYLEKTIQPHLPHVSSQLLGILQNTRLENKQRKLAASLLAQNQKTPCKEKILITLEKEIAYAYIWKYLLHAWKSNPPPLKDLIHQSLQGMLEASLELIVHLLIEIYAKDQRYVLKTSLKHHNLKVRSQAVETLEKFASKRIFILVEPLLGYSASTSKIKTNLKKLKIPPHSERFNQALFNYQSKLFESILPYLKPMFPSFVPSP